MEKLTNDQITPEQLEKWAQAYPTLRETTLIVEPQEGKEKSLKFFIKKPNRDQRLMVGKAAKKDKVMEVSQMLIANCVLGGDMEFLADPSEHSADPFMAEACDLTRETVLEEISKLMDTAGSSKKVRPQQTSKAGKK